MSSTTAAQTTMSLTGTLRCGGKNNNACSVISRTGNSKKVNSLEGNAEYHSFDEFGVDAVEGRCGKCGSRRHTAGSCTADVSKIRCFRCEKAGHVSFNWPENGKGKGIVKSDMWDKKGSKGVKGSKGSKGKGKKGKLNEVSEDWTDWTAESWDDDDYWWHDQWPESCDGQWGVSQTWWDDGSGWYCDRYGYTWQQEPVQSAEVSVSHDNRSDVQKTGSVGSMIINPLLYDLTCETTGGLRFVHEHDLAVDSPSCGSRCGCNGAELEFADMETENRLVVDCNEFEEGAHFELITLGIPRCPETFMKEATEAGHPRHALARVSDLMKSTLQEVFLGDPFKLRSKRASFLKKWMKRAVELRADEKKLHDNLPAHLQRLLSNKKLLLWKEILVDLEYPDFKVVDEICQGFPLTSNQQYSKSKWSRQPCPFSSLQEWPEVWTWLL